MRDFSREGLSESQATERLIRFGLNELPESKKKNFWTESLRLLKEPMLVLLIVAGAIYFVMGELGEAIMLSASIFVVIGISIYQEHKSEKALASLRELSSPRALVIRDGSELRISATLLVPGDFVALHEGDRVPADGVIVHSSHLMVDESLLTGESLPITKPPSSKIFSSTLVVGGTAFFRVEFTGAATEVGKIGKTLQEPEPEELGLSKEIRSMVLLFTWTGGLICAAIIILYGLYRGTWTQAFLAGLATQMSLLPEEFPVVLTIFLAMGAWRLSKVQVLIRRPGSIERLGAVTVLCVDKTGTLTQNKMTVAALHASDQTIFFDGQEARELSEVFHEVAEYGVLASHRDPFDPMEKAIRQMVEEGNWGREHLHHDWDIIKDYPLSNKLFAMSCVWKDPRSDSYVIAAKGAPEAIIDLCHLNQADADKALTATREMARQGLRVLAVAKATFLGSSLPGHQHEFDFTWIGLIGLEDPLRPEVPHAVKLCRTAGIRVIMMTGDYPETALKIASRAGLDTDDSLIEGSQLESLKDLDLTNKLKTAHIFARMVPEQKLRVVKLLKNLGHVVAMTGDGVNDAPSLKWADVGIAMGARGTDVAREASDIVLLDDNFASIVSGIERGRLIFRNIQKAMAYIVSIHVPIAGLSILPILFGWPIILLPVHIVFLELIIDPACSLMFESQPVEAETMSSKPRQLHSRLFSTKDFLRSFFQGFFVLAVTTAVIWYDAQMNHDDPERVRALGFIILALSNLALIFSDMSGGSPSHLRAIFKRTNNKLILFGIFIGLFGVTQVTSIRSLLHFGPLHFNEILTSLAISLLIFTVVSFWNWTSKKHA